MPSYGGENESRDRIIAGCEILNHVLTGLGAELEKKYTCQVKLIRGKGGVFEVSVDNKLLFSKKSLNRFPNDGEVESLIDAR